MDNISKATIYLLGSSADTKDSLNLDINNWLSKNYKLATFKISDAPNAFTQMFPQTKEAIEIKFFGDTDEGKITIEEIVQITSLNREQFVLGLGLINEKTIELVVDKEKLQLYNISYQNFLSEVRNALNDSELSPQNIANSTTQIILKQSGKDFHNAIHQTFQNNQGQRFAFSTFIQARNGQAPRFITADKNGVYQSIHLQKDLGYAFDSYEQEIKEKALDKNFVAELSGSIFTNRALLNELIVIFFISIALLYLILAFQFESLLQPLIVMMTMPLGFTGGIFLLYITNNQLDIMAAIGFVVVLGIIVDDPILKIEMINRIKRRRSQKDSLNTKPTLEEIIHEAGTLSLKPLLLTSLTTTFALIPILFTPGLGSELQKPMVLVIIGGLSIGLLFTMVFIPLTYWYCYQREYNSKKLDS